jgi:hypothetical protein
MRTAYRNLIDTATTVTASTQLTNNPVSNVRDGRLTTKWISDTTTSQSVVVELPTFPEYPDFVTTGTYIQDAWATTDSWSPTNATLSVTTFSGVLRINSTAANANITRTGFASIAAGRTIKVKIRSALASTLTILNAAGSSVSTITGVTSTYSIVEAVTATAATTLSVTLDNTAVGVAADIDWIYVCTGQYANLLNDYSGNGNHGTVFGCTPVAGITGRALSGDGVNDYTSQPILHPTAGFTLSAWIKTVTTGVAQAIMARDQLVGGNRGFFFAVEATTGILTSYMSGDGLDANIRTTNGTGNIGDNSWHLVQLVFTPSTSIKFYIDGALNATNTTSIPASLFNNNLPVTLFRRDNVANPRWFGGTIDDPRIYNRALSQAEITSLYNREPFASEMLGLVGWWKLDKDYHVNTAAILGHNIKSGTTVKIQANNSDVWGDPELSETFTYVASDATILRFLDEVKVYKYWRFSFTGQASVEAGRLWLGEYMTINPASLLDFTVTKKRSDVVIYGRDRQKFANPGVGWRRFSLKFPASDKAMIYKVEQMYDAVGQHTSFIFCNFDTSREWPLVEPVYCSFDNDLDFTHTQRQKYSYTLNIEEDK